MSQQVNVQTIIQNIVDKLVADYKPRQIYLYGSHAGGKAGPDSDIDLLIVKDTPKPFLKRWTAVRRLISGLHKSIPVEPLVLTPAELEYRLSIGDQFIQQILKQGKLLHAS